MKDEKRAELVKENKEHIGKIKELAENCMEHIELIQGNSEKEAACNMLFLLLCTPLIEKIARNCAEIADEDSASRAQENQAENH